MTDAEYLESKGWTLNKNNARHYGSWCWLQPKTGALFQLQDAVETQQALDRNTKIGAKDARRTPSTSV